MGALGNALPPYPPAPRPPSFAIVAFACTAAHIVPSFGVVLAYNGALLGTLQQLVFPAPGGEVPPSNWRVALLSLLSLLSYCPLLPIGPKSSPGEGECPVPPPPNK